MATTKKRDELVCTEYAYRDRKSGLWFNASRGYVEKTFKAATKTTERMDVDEKRIQVVTCRCRGLSPRTKASKKRTR